ncbi:hypothetical protein BCIN_14g05580 [Botrytis cinerea B05.10]|uniref:FAD-binding domain-containing protein n=3 Tax=Botryotinia fuckeliana TaxID=40559 RepID=A0A384K3K0_BOTFB|nr:hypothetical protein BCIN_14g05580 [Botrytis cinerea B05.10]ATZ57416.1 hypothetical protein BCIN_14g05580 [Botrytis cinerea B05.10]EMR82989.1 putative fad-dependent monooxygenase protein [Botrytis cinerea BcDW1]CCD43019.1 similar to monooxygenase FAD-binding [Botrytis cinerea T4]
MSDNFDVVIVGCGPVGLFLACELRLGGLSVLIVERRKAGEMGAGSRACIVHGRTLEIMEARGLLEKMLGLGELTNWWHFGILETRLDYSVFGNETKQNRVLILPQYSTEDILKQRAEKLGVNFIIGTVVESLEPSATSVTVKGTSVDGTSFMVTSKYLVGADGVHSMVQRAAGFDFEKSSIGTNTMITGEVSLGAEVCIPYVVKNDKGVVIAAPLDKARERVRIGAWVASRPNIPASTPLGLEEFNQTLEEASGIDWKCYNPEMLYRFTNATGIVKNYRKGRIFLVGDAAHHHLPAGGQGLNLGLQEAFNLGWKLAAVVRDNAPESLLDTYQTERIDIAKSVVKNTTAQSLLFFANTQPELEMRGTMNKLLSVPEGNRALAWEISGFWITYPKPLDMIAPVGWEALPEELAGKRALDVKIRGPTNEEKWLSEYSTAGKWVQLQFLDRLSGKTPSLPAFDNMTEVVEVKEILEGPGAIYQESGLSEILIRPDSYLGFGKR